MPMTNFETICFHNVIFTFCWSSRNFSPMDYEQQVGGNERFAMKR